MWRNLPFAVIATLTLGLAPYTPEPHIVGKLRWILGGAVGMQPADWFDVLMHGAPFVWLGFALLSRLPPFASRRAEALRQMLADDALLLDVRSVSEFASGSIEGAHSAPVDTVPGAVDALTGGDKARPVILFCQSGGRSGRAMRVLKGAGYTRVENLGGIGAASRTLAALRDGS